MKPDYDMELMPRHPFMETSENHRQSFTCQVRTRTPNANSYRQSETFISKINSLNYKYRGTNDTRNTLSLDNNRSLNLSNVNNISRLFSINSPPIFEMPDRCYSAPSRRNSSEIKSGNLVLISSFQWGTDQTRAFCTGDNNSNVTTANSHRYPVMVKVYKKRFDHYAVVSRTKRHQDMAPLYIKLNRSAIIYDGVSTHFTIRLFGSDSKEYKFEASGVELTQQWVEAFTAKLASPEHSPSPARRMFRDRLHSAGSDTDSIAEEDESEVNDDSNSITEEEDIAEVDEDSEGDNEDVFPLDGQFSSVSSYSRLLSISGKDNVNNNNTYNKTTKSRSSVLKRPGFNHRSTVRKSRELQRQELIQALYSPFSSETSESDDISDSSLLSSSCKLPVLDESPDEYSDEQ